MKSVFGFSIHEPKSRTKPTIPCPQTETRPKLLAGGLRGRFEKIGKDQIWIGPKGWERKVYVEKIVPDEIVKKTEWKLAKAIKGVEDGRNNVPRVTNVHPGQLKEVHCRRDFLAQGANESHMLIRARTENTTRKAIFRARNESDIREGKSGSAVKLLNNVRSNFDQQSRVTNQKINSLYRSYKVN